LSRHAAAAFDDDDDDDNDDDDDDKMFGFMATQAYSAWPSHRG